MPGGLLLTSTRLPLLPGDPATGVVPDLDGPLIDVRVGRGVVEEIGVGLGRRPGEAVLDCGGGTLLPGLSDHHLHLHALAASGSSARCGPPWVQTGADLANTLAAASADPHGWVRGVGYVETVHGRLDARALDRLHGSRPVRIQHRGGSMWMLNSIAVTRLGLAGADHPGVERDTDGAPTGVLWRADDWLRARLPASDPPRLSGVGSRLASFGITAVTDATPDLNPTALEAISAAIRSGALPQRVMLLGAPLSTHFEGRLGGRLDEAPEASPVAGPYKIVLADSGLPTLDGLAERIAAAHRARRPVALHCVTEAALVLLIAAFGEVGVRRGDRIEHAGLVPRDLLPELARLGLTVVTQPGFLAHRGDDFARDLPAAQHGDLYRCRSLMHAGIPVALSSDAPYGPLDPWQVIAAATHRRGPDATVIGPDERVAPARALVAYLGDQDDPGGRRRTVHAGGPADLVVLRVPLTEALRSPDREVVRTVLIGGKTVYSR